MVIVEDAGKRVGENGHGFLERYSVFDPVRDCLACVPFKPQVHPAAPTVSHIPNGRPGWSERRTGGFSRSGHE